MLKSSLLEIIRTFSKQELPKFEDFVRSPYFNKKENVINLLLEIKKYAPDFISENLEKEKVWKKLFPDTDYNYGIMKNLIFDLGKLCDSFLCEEIYKDNEMQRSYDLLTSHFSRNTEIYQNKFESTKRTFQKNLESNNYVLANEFYKQFGNIYELNANFYHIHSTQNKKRDDLRFASEYTVYEFLLSCFRIFQKVMVQNLDLNQPPKDNIIYKILKKMDDNLILQEIIDHSNDSSIKDHKILKVYYLMYKALISNENRDAYLEFKKYLPENSAYISNDEAKALYLSLLTCFSNLKTTSLEFNKEYLSIVRMGLKDKVMLNKDGSIEYQLFFSIVNVSCGANEIEFAKNFINNYKDKLPANLREAVYNFSMAQLNFNLRHFEKALEFLSLIRNEPKFLKYSIKNLQLSIYYELNDRDAFDYSFDSFKHFVGKNKLTNESREIAQTHYCNFIKTLFRIREKPDAHDLSELKKEITLNKVSSKKWFLEKIEALEKMKS